MKSKSEVIVFNGIKFRRYPESKYYNHRNYYAPNGKHIKQGVKNLHVEIWKSVHGELPEGCHIHHKDGNALNNSIENLECLTKKEHFEHHAKDSKVRQGIAFSKTEKFKEMQRAAAKWHGSEEGRKWHSEHGKEVFANREEHELFCEVCQNKFKTKWKAQTRFCSNKCKAKWRRDAGLDNVKKKCERCDEPFVRNKYDKARFCSRICAAKSTAYFSRQKLE